MENPIYTKTWVLLRNSIELRCYTASWDIGMINKHARIVAKTMGNMVGTKVDPKTLKIGNNKHGGYLHYNFTKTPEEIEALRPTLKAQGWTEGKSSW